MSYKTYTTEALVCGSKDSYTSDRAYLLFTKEAGMLWANAKSVREERSKQRYALQDFSHVRVSLVKGKSGWRIGSVEALGNMFLSARSRAERGRVTFVVSQLRRYVHGEMALGKIYNDAFVLLKNLEQEQLKYEYMQKIFSVRLMTELGYVAPHASWKHIVLADEIEEVVEEITDEMSHSISTAILEATQASHL